MILGSELVRYKQARDEEPHDRDLHRGGCEATCARCALDALIREVERIEALEREPLTPVMIMHGRSRCGVCKEQKTPIFMFGVRKDYSSMAAVCLDCMKLKVTETEAGP